MRGGEGTSQFQSESDEVGEGRGPRAFVVGHMRLGGGRKKHRSREEARQCTFDFIEKEIIIIIIILLGMRDDIYYYDVDVDVEKD